MLPRKLQANQYISLQRAAVQPASLPLPRSPEKCWSQAWLALEGLPRFPLRRAQKSRSVDMRQARDSDRRFVRRLSLLPRGPRHHPPDPDLSTAVALPQLRRLGLTVQRLEVLLHGRAVKLGSRE